MEEQYFDDWEVAEGKLWLINWEERTKAPVKVRSIGWSGNAIFPTRVVIYQDAGGDWYSRKQFYNEASAKAFAVSISQMSSHL